MHGTDTNTPECRECKYIFLLAFAVLLAFFIVTFMTRGSALVLTNGASTTVSNTQSQVATTGPISTLSQ